MVTLLGALLGFFTSAFPDFLKLFRESKDRAHELRIIELQMQHQKDGFAYKLEEIQTQADIAEAKYLAARDNPDKHYSKWINNLRGSVRPILTYAFFSLYAFIKIAVLYKLGLDAVLDTPWHIWTEEDSAIFAAVITFWFGSRTFNRVKKSN